MTQVMSHKKTYVRKPEQPIKKVAEGHFVVRSDRFPQLWYTCRLTNDQCYCACEFFKYKHEICKHLFKCMELEERVV